MMHSIVNNTAPKYLTSRFVRRCDLTSCLREDEYKVAVPQPRAEFYKRSLSYRGSVLWNSLPLEVRQLSSPIKVSATLKIAIFPYLRFQRFQLDMLESFLLKQKSEENIIAVERYWG